MVERININTPLTPKSELKKAAQDFEALFLHQLLQEMRKSLNQSWDIAGGGFGSNMVRDLFDGELASYMAKAKGLGIADIITKQLSPKVQNFSEKSDHLD
ncbi:MAG: rod-binding protein [Elusimicrobiota bacterium]